jgi:transcriptional regulator with XRE-family HTH domain
MPDPRAPTGEPPAARVGEAVRRLRDRAGWSIHRLARDAGVSSATVFKIEKGRMAPSVTVLLKIARALKQPLGDLVGDAPEPGGRRFLHVSEPTAIRFADLPIALERLVGPLPDRQLEAGLYVVEAGAASTPEPLRHAGEEIYFVVEGKFRFEIDGESAVLQAGHALHLKGEAPHRWQNVGRARGRLLFVLTPPPFVKPSRVTEATVPRA